MSGLNFETINPLGLSMTFKECILDYSIFTNLDVSSTDFGESSLVDCDFSGAALQRSDFQNCNLADATFDRTNLEKADFRGARNLRLDLAKNRLKKAVFNREQAVELLERFDLVFE